MSKQKPNIVVRSDGPEGPTVRRHYARKNGTTFTITKDKTGEYEDILRRDGRSETFRSSDGTVHRFVLTPALVISESRPERLVGRKPGGHIPG
jgi:hypothetical protein